MFPLFLASVAQGNRDNTPRMQALQHHAGTPPGQCAAAPPTRSTKFPDRVGSSVAIDSSVRKDPSEKKHTSVWPTPPCLQWLVRAQGLIVAMCTCNTNFRFTFSCSAQPWAFMVHTQCTAICGLSLVLVMWCRNYFWKRTLAAVLPFWAVGASLGRLWILAWAWLASFQWWPTRQL